MDDRFIVDLIEVCQDPGFEFGLGSDPDMTQHRARHLGEEPLHEIEPGTVLSRLRKFGFTERYRFDSLTSSIRWRTWTDAWCRPSDCCDVQLP